VRPRFFRETVFRHCDESYFIRADRAISLRQTLLRCQMFFARTRKWKCPAAGGKAAGHDTKRHPINMRASSHVPDNGALKNEVNLP
jgi:hypothetical protein